MRRTKITAFITLTAISAFLLVLRFTPPAGGQTDSGRSANLPGNHRTTQAEAMAILGSDYFDQMSSAGQMNVQRMAGAKKIDGVIKPYDFSAAAASFKVPLVTGKRGGPATSSFVDPLVNDPTADTAPKTVQSETAIVLGSGNNVISAFNDSGSFVGVSKFTGYSTSADAGTSWTDRGALPTAAGNGDAGDPGLARINSTGVILLTTLNFDVVQNLNIYRSTDNGVTFSTPPINGAPGFVGAAGNQDKQWIAVDNFAGAGNGNAYLAWRNFGSPGGMTLTRSTDGGLTWGPSGGVTIAAGGQGAQVAVGPDHSVYFEWLSGTSISICRSTDQGVTFGAPTTVTPILSTGTNGDLGLGGGFRSSTFPQLVVNPVNGNLYTVYPDKVVAPADKADIFFRQSTDNGTTWSVPVRVNTDLGTNDNFQPSLAVTPDGTGLFVGHYDRRRSSNNTRIEYWGRTATISGNTVTFGCNFPISSSDFPVVIGSDPSVNATYMGDYDVATASNANYYVQWGDNRLGNPDVRFALVPKAGVTTPALLALAGQSLSGPPLANSCNNLTITVGNEGCSATIGSVTGTLTTSTAGVTIVNATENFGSIPSGGTGSNSANPFMISISPGFVCGTTISLTLTMSNGDVIPLSISTQGTGYTFTTMTGQAIVPGTLDTGNHGDDVVTNIALPFSFSYYGTAFAAANVSSNGNLQFTSTSTAFTNACPLPFATFNNPIMPFWDDLRTDVPGGTTTGIFTSVSGVAPNRIFNIEWRASYFTGTGNPNFEIRLYETTNQIDFIYGNAETGASATIGLQKGTGSGGASDFSTFSCNQASLSAGLKVSWVFSTNCVQGTGTCAGAPVPSSAVSRKTHNTTPTPTDFDVPLPLVPVSGAVGIEPRLGPAYTMVVTFASSVTTTGATVTTGTGTVGSVTGSGTSTIVINLTGVTDVQRLGVTLNNVNDGMGHVGNVLIPMGVLVGDTNASGGVSGADVAQTKAQSGQPAGAGNFRTDVNASGGVSGADIAAVKAQSGHVLPP